VTEARKKLVESGWLSVEQVRPGRTTVYRASIPEWSSWATGVVAWATGVVVLGDPK
jgi:hypothetical protein